MILREEIRLVTLTGPPGVGKTRLALKVAADLAAWFEHGSAFVDLTPVTNPSMVAQAITHALGIWQVSGRFLEEQLRGYLQNRELLLLLDNFEHVVEASVLVARLVEASPHLKILVTSREALHLSWEHEWYVPPLSVPPIMNRIDPAEVVEYPAVALFVIRARASQADFVVTEQNAPVLAEICVRLDGLPLAIELAAARLKILTPHAILERLGHRLSLLATPARDLPPRHRTLRGAIGWSYTLLSPAEQTLFRRLSAFVGGCTLEAAEAVAAGNGPMDVLDGLASLVDKNLLQREAQADGGVRFRMLETIRAFGHEQLAGCGDLSKARNQHATFFLAMAERAEGALRKPEGIAWLARLDAEHDNLRVALEWMEEKPGEDGLRLSAALWPYWSGRGYYSEGREWLKRALAKNPDASAPVRVKALLAAGAMALIQDDYGNAVALLEEGLALATREGDVNAAAIALATLGHTAWHQGNPRRANELCAESVKRGRESGDPWVLAATLSETAAVAWHDDDYHRMSTMCEEAVSVSKDLADVPRIASPSPLTLLGMAAQRRRDFTRAAALFAESLARARMLGDRYTMATSLVQLGDVANLKGDLDRAWASYKQALALFHEIGERWHRARCLEALARVALNRSVPVVAARLLGAAEAVREGIGARGQPPADSLAGAARKALSEDGFATAWADGAMSPEQTVHYALTVSGHRPAGLPSRLPGRHPDLLTRREMDVAALLARGLSNREIAAALFISEKTSAHHVQHILEKLHFRSRAQVAAWAVQQRLLTTSPDST